MKIQNKNTNKGITLIALVITIIVMLILVAVTMAVNGGLFKQAGRAGTQTNEKRDAEQEFANLDSDMTYDDLINKYTEWEKGGKQDGNEGETPQEKGPKIGDYVNYPVEYINVAMIINKKTGEGSCYPKDELTGWRVISKQTDEDGNILNIKLVSSRVPLNYYHYDNSAISIENLKNNFLKTEIDATTLTQYKFFNCGFKSVTGTTLESTFANEFTFKVESLTKEDVGFEKDVELTSEEYNNLYAIPGKDMDCYVGVWLANESSYGVLYSLWNAVCGEEIIDRVHGIRPVVTLKTNVKFNIADEKINNTTTWDISI